MVDPKILKGGAEDNLLASSSYIANAHIEIYMPFARKKWLFETTISNMGGGGRPHRPPYESATVTVTFPAIGEASFFVCKGIKQYAYCSLAQWSFCFESYAQGYK